MSRSLDLKKVKSVAHIGFGRVVAAVSTWNQGYNHVAYFAGLVLT